MMAPVALIQQEVQSRIGDGTDPVIYRNALIARFALDLPQTVAALSLPASALALYPDLARRLAETIPAEFPDYEADSLARDVAHVFGFFIPGAAMDIDRFGRLDPRMIASAAVRCRQLTAPARYVWGGMWRPFLEFHTDSRHLTGFNPAGFHATYLQVADMLRCNPALAGLFISSWFHDPIAAEISPRLAYLQGVPRAGGAFFIRNNTGELHVKRATATSATRRQLVADGKYVPTCYTMIWPRKKLIAWADGINKGRRDAGGLAAPAVAPSGAMSLASDAHFHRPSLKSTPWPLQKGLKRGEKPAVAGAMPDQLAPEMPA
ncbi:hypothetical protein [Paracoccus sp. MC1862]|uniref:hypothetical protein n=2 Tax=Paracoccus TaxID=265 RepID=UPI00190940C1|nr:hypothetical protein [Paracoccus sp. MC1862]QQO44275.1 hypothetical protein JGR78_12990 [Paracoccus sp. MC1862]